MEAKTKNILVGVGIGILTYILIKNKKPSTEIKSSAEGEDTISVDGEYYNADGDFYGADGNFYDADGSFMGADGSFESAEAIFTVLTEVLKVPKGMKTPMGRKEKEESSRGRFR